MIFTSQALHHLIPCIMHTVVYAFHTAIAIPYYTTSAITCLRRDSISLSLSSSTWWSGKELTTLGRALLQYSLNHSLKITSLNSTSACPGKDYSSWWVYVITSSLCTQHKSTHANVPNIGFACTVLSWNKPTLTISRLFSKWAYFSVLLQVQCSKLLELLSLSYSSFR